MTHMEREFIAAEHDSEEELREFKRQLGIKIKKFEAEISRAWHTFDHLRNTLINGVMVPLSDTNYAEMTYDSQRGESVDSRSTTSIL